MTIYNINVQFWQLNQSENNLKCVKTNLRNKESLTRVGSTRKSWKFGHSRQFTNYYFEENVFEKNTGNSSVIVVNGMSNGQKQTESTNTFTTLNSWLLAAIHINFHSSDKHIEAADSRLLGELMNHDYTRKTKWVLQISIQYISVHQYTFKRQIIFWKHLLNKFYLA